jgi:RND family efflux transporter MFP subunit
MSSKTLKLVIPVLVIIAGIAAAAVITSARKAPPRVDRPALGPLVEVMPVEITDVPVVVSGHGEVVARVSVDIVPQVAGQVVATHRSLVAGGFFKSGEVLVEIDPRDYELAVERAQAAVARAKVTLEREQAEADVAREEWKGLHPDEEPTALVIREPQIRQAEAEHAAALADLSVAQLNLERTKLSLPFDGVVVSESVDVGQFVGNGSRLATVYGTDVVEVRVPLDSGEMAWFDVPSRRGGRGAAAEVSVGSGAARSVRKGRVTRMEAQVDQMSRMVHVVIEVPEPYETAAGQSALLPGTFVDVRIFGRTMEEIVAVPRYAVHDGDRVWVFADGALEIRDVEIVRADREQTLLSSGLETGDLLIVSSLDAVTEGMTIRRADTSNPNPQEPTTDEAGGAV